MPLSDSQEKELVGGRDTDLHSHSFDRAPTNDTVQNLSTVERVRKVTTNYTAVTTDDFILVDTAGGAVTITLPSARGGKRYVIERIAGANNVTVTPVAGTTINGAASATISTSYAPLRVKAMLGNYYNA
jgi:hypothetical protein